MASILGWAGLPVDTPLIDSLVMFDRRRLQTGLAELGVDPAAVPVSARVDRLPSYPLTVLGYDEPELLLGAIWDGRRFVDGAPQRMLEQVRATLLEFADRPAGPLAELELAAPAEPGLIAGWNRTGGRLPGRGHRAGAVRRAGPPAAGRARRCRARTASTATPSWTSAATGWPGRCAGAGCAPDTPVAVALPRGAGPDRGAARRCSRPAAATCRSTRPARRPGWPA